jgi:Fe-S-cluster containining protein
VLCRQTSHPFVMKNHQIKTECDRCGTCCKKGGPALHHEDIGLLRINRLNQEELITIRKGEPVLLPHLDKPEPAESEIIKIKGRGSEWTCLFYITEKSECAIYTHRPLECSLFKCWDTADLENEAGKNLLSRHDMIPADDPILSIIKIHEEKCSLQNFDQLLAGLHNNNTLEPALADLTNLVNSDLSIRSKACERFHLSLELELFFFGRPLFKILEQFGLKMHIINGVCCLSY